MSSTRPKLSARLSSALPARLKNGNGSGGIASGGNSAANSRSSSPRRSPKDKMTDKVVNGLVLRASVLKGRNLAAKDKNGTSDPYFVLTTADAREATASLPKTLNPEWNETFEFTISRVDHLVLKGVCWDKDKFKKDYMGELEVFLEEVFPSADVLVQEPKWYPLRSTRKGKKSSDVSGDISLHFSLVDATNRDATPQQIYAKFKSIAGAMDSELDGVDEFGMSRTDSGDLDDDLGSDAGIDEGDDGTGTDIAAKKRRKLRLAKIKRRATLRAFEFNGGDSGIAGILYLEVIKIIDLPPEKNFTKTGFDMDPFVVISLGKKTYRTPTVSHNLNPVFNERMIFQVANHEIKYSVRFDVADKDKVSNHDFVGSANFALDQATAVCGEPDPETGLYKLPEISEHTEEPAKRKKIRNPLSRNSSAQELTRLTKPPLKKEQSSSSLLRADQGAPEAGKMAQLAISQAAPLNGPNDANGQTEDPEMRQYTLPLQLKNQEKWDMKHSPVLYIKAKYMPYLALRQQFWRAMLKQYDTDDSNEIDKVELTTMLDNLGSTLHESTIDGFFSRFADVNRNTEIPYLTFDQAVICLEDQLQKTLQRSRSYGSSLRSYLRQNSSGADTPDDTPGGTGARTPGDRTPINESSQTTLIPIIQTEHHGTPGEEGAVLDANDLAEEGDEEHVIEIRECPICHQPRLNKKSDADIITHIATCASQDWREVNNIVMAGFVTSSQAQRKWYSKVINKVSYGGYKLGANSANILVQDRITGQINEEKMSVYVRLGIRLLYKGLKSRDMEGRRIRNLLRSLSEKQGRKYDDPASAAQIQGFIKFHQLDMSEVLLHTSEFKTFNEFFYRALKPTARPCSAPDRPEIVTSPADCRSVVFNTLDEAQKIWVKGREFTVERLFGDAYPEDASRYTGGSFGIFRLAPQDYHRFHVPVDGVIGEPKTIAGEYYTVNPMAIRSALDVYGENVRVLVPIDSETHGRVMFVCIGAMMVGSTVITRNAGDTVKRAEELGYFKFGGSTVLLLFEPGKMVFDDDLIENSRGALETLVRVGMSIGHSQGYAPHTPDMRKENPTMEEKQEAKRRIEGALAPEAKPSIATAIK